MELPGLARGPRRRKVSGVDGNLPHVELQELRRCQALPPRSCRRTLCSARRCGWRGRDAQCTPCTAQRAPALAALAALVGEPQPQPARACCRPPFPLLLLPLPTSVQLGTVYNHGQVEKGSAFPTCINGQLVNSSICLSQWPFPISIAGPTSTLRQSGRLCVIMRRAPPKTPHSRPAMLCTCWFAGVVCLRDKLAIFSYNMLSRLTLPTRSALLSSLTRREMAAHVDGFTASVGRTVVIGER